MPTGGLSICALPMKRMVVHGVTFLSVRWSSRVIPVPPMTKHVMTAARIHVLLATRHTVPANDVPPRAISRQYPMLYAEPGGRRRTLPISAAP